MYKKSRDRGTYKRSLINLLGVKTQFLIINFILKIVLAILIKHYNKTCDIPTIIVKIEKCGQPFKFLRV